MELVSILRVIHVVTAILMAWPFYALVVVNQRALLGPPLGDRADLFMENIVKSRVIPCYILQLTALVTGLWLMSAANLGVDALVKNWVLGAKFVLLLVIATLLSVVHFRIQPQLNALFARSQDRKIPDADAAQIRSLRATRKKLASICLFCVLTISMLGVQAFAAFPLWLTGLLVLFIAAFTWRAYTSQMNFGWL